MVIIIRIIITTMFQKIYQKLQTREGITLVASTTLIVITLGIILGGIGYRHRARSVSGGTQRPTIAVVGKGEVFAVPDVAQFTFTITKDAPTMANAQKQVADIGNKILEQLSAVGIEDKDIKTEGFNAYPKYENKMIAVTCSPTYCPPNSGNPVVVGYTVSHTYSVKVRNLEKAPDIAKLLTDANVSSINGPDFTIADLDAIKNEARGKAIIDAQEQAKILAKQLGVHLGKIIDFQVVDAGYYPMSLYARDTLASGAVAEKVSAPSIEPGQSDINVQVQVTYTIR
jgi:uncharacterized protein YggE